MLDRGVWSNREFLKMWLGGSVSAIGSQVTTLALPLVAVLLLNAGPAETGLLTAASLAPNLLLGLFAGVWVDRLPPRMIRITANALNAVVIAFVPLAGFIGLLQLETLYVTSFVAGTLTMFARLAQSALLPRVVSRRQLLDANGAVLGSFAFAQIVGPSLAGVLMQVVSPTAVLLVDAASFVFSAACYVVLREPPPAPSSTPRAGMLNEIGEGLAWLRGNEVLLRLTVTIGLANVAWFAVQAVMVPFATLTLGLSPALLGFALGVTGPFSLLGAVLAARIARQFGLGPTLVASLSGELLSRIVLILASGPPLAAASVVGLSQAIFGFIAPLWDVNSSSLRQAITPERLLGRVSAATTFVGLGAAPLGAVLGGYIGDLAGPRAALVAATAVTAVSVGLLLVPSVLRLRAPSSDA
ncbi:MAG TPA: MFS transporter [Chloroflexota bacterium]|nr:MFS transporter [Chloroflexota bacterium]